MKHKNTIALSIPTGTGASIGGYAGDGGKIARMFSKYFNVLTHPNVVNGGILSAMNDNILYAEGYIFDEFFKGNVELTPLEDNEENVVGVVFDKSIPNDILNVHINTINALKEVKGYNIPYYEITEEEVKIEFYLKEKVSSGVVGCEKTLLKSAKSLINKGCNAIAVVCYFGSDTDSIEYESGVGVDPIGGIEAVISHYLSKELMCPVAHSPAFSTIDILTSISNPKTSSENISSTYLPCILDGLIKAPKIVKKGTLKNKDIKALIVPYGAFGGIASIAALENNIKIVSVQNKMHSHISCYDIKRGDIIEYMDYNSCLKNLIKDFK